MIEATQKKLRETQFFAQLLLRESENVVSNEPEAFVYFLSAFLSAGRSVTFALQNEEKEKYDAWFQLWWNAQTPEDRDLMDALKLQRNVEQKQGGAKTTVEWQYIPITEVRRDERGHPAYGIHWFAPPDTPLPQVGRLVHSFELAGSKAEVTAACKRYVDLLEKLVREFIQAHQ
jgi:hypothetical protein